MRTHKLSLILGERCCVYISISGSYWVSVTWNCLHFIQSDIHHSQCSSFLWLFKTHIVLVSLPLSTHVLHLADELCILTATLLLLVHMPALKILYPGSSIAYASYRHIDTWPVIENESPNSKVSLSIQYLWLTSNENLITTQQY